MVQPLSLFDNFFLPALVKTSRLSRLCSHSAGTDVRDAGGENAQDRNRLVVQNTDRIDAKSAGRGGCGGAGGCT